MMGRFIRKYWVLLVVCFVLTVAGVKVGVESRGYFAFGGEWVVAPFLMWAWLTAENLIREYEEYRRRQEKKFLRRRAAMKRYGKIFYTYTGKPMGGRKA